MKTKLRHRYDFPDPSSIRLSSRSFRFIVIIILLVIISFQLSSLIVPPPTTRFLLWFDGAVDNKNLTTTSKKITNTTVTTIKMKTMNQNSFHHLTIFSTNTRAHGPKGIDQSVCDAFLSSSTTTTATPNSISYVQDSCQDVQIGNKLSRIYMTFAMALTINASFSFTCHHHHHHHHLQQQQEEEEESNTVIGLLAKYNNLLQHVQQPSIQPLLSLSSLNEICTNCDTQHPHECNSNIGIETVLHYIRNHLRTIFLLQQQQEMKIINISNNNQEEGGREETEVTSVFDNDDETAPHSSSSSSIDVAIHYRCGDIMGIHASKYGFLPHSTYSNLIQQRHSAYDSIHIAIITQPLSTRTTTTTTIVNNNNNNNNAIRSKDLPFVEKCYYIVNDLVKYLKKEFPNSTISIQSLTTPPPSSSSIVQDYSMLILARSMTICGPSTFCLWPTLASNNPYIYESKLFPWIKQLKKKKEKMEKSSSSNGIDYYYNTFTSPRLSPTQNLTLDEMELETILIWLQNT